MKFEDFNFFCAIVNFLVLIIILWLCKMLMFRDVGERVYGSSKSEIISKLKIYTYIQEKTVYHILGGKNNKYMYIFP